MFCQANSGLEEDNYDYYFDLQIVDEIYSDYDIKKQNYKYCNLSHCRV